MTATALPRTPRVDRPTLRRRALSRAELALIFAGTLATTVLLFALTELQGRAGFLVVLALLYAAAQTAISFSVEGRRRAADRLLSLGVYSALVAALLPLAAVLIYTVAKGMGQLTPYFLTHSMRGVGPLDGAEVGGIYHAMLGTLEQVLIATAISVPIGLLAAVYTAEYGRGRLASSIRFVTDVMTGVPSIVVGLFIFSFWVIGLGRGFSGFAAALALSILMLPVVIRSTEEMLKLVPDSLREASYALGVPKWKTILSIVLPTASAGITTGVMLAVARVTGETAPLLLTAFGLDSIHTNPFEGRQSALPMYIFEQATSSARGAFDRAWGAALMLIIIVLVLYTAARLLTRRNRLVSR